MTAYRLTGRLALWLAIVILWQGVGFAQVPELKSGVVKVIVTSPAHVTGSGFIVARTSSRAYIVTAAHVVENANTIEVQFFPGDQAPVPAGVRHVEALNPQGMALLEVAGGFPPGVSQLSLARESSVSGGEAIAAIGHQPSAGNWGVITGTVSSRMGREITIQAPLEEQASGSPLLRNNEVVGLVVSARMNFGYAITAAAVREYVKGFGVDPDESALEKAEPSSTPMSSVSWIELMWKSEHCGRAVRHGDSIVEVRLVEERGRSLMFEVDHFVDSLHAAGNDGIRRSAPMLYANVGVLPLDEHGERLWESFVPGRAVRSGSGTAKAIVALRADLPVIRSKYLFVSIWEVGILDGFKLCKLVTFERSW